MSEANEVEESRAPGQPGGSLDSVRASAAGLLDAIGSTPLVELDPGDGAPSGTRLFAKLESINPGGSIKDRPVARILTAAIERGDVRPGSADRRLLDSSSGNAGISYAQLGAALGVPVTLVVPGNASAERLARIRSYGAELVLTDPQEGYDHAIETARRMAADEPERYWYADQYGNEDNWRAHYEGTGVEILEEVDRATGAPPDVLVAGVGTGGTLTGVGRRLREAARTVWIASVRPEIFPGIEGLKPLGQEDDLVPAILDRRLIDEVVEVTSEQAVAACRTLAARGLFVGPSSGAYVHAARRLAAAGRGGVIVTLLSDTGERYLSTGMWD